MATRMQQRRGTASQWTTANPVLAAGEIGFEIDTNKFKMGDGINQWDDLDYFASADAIADLIDGAPELLDTLNELAAAIGDDPNFANNLANAFAEADLAVLAAAQQDADLKANAAIESSNAYTDNAILNEESARANAIAEHADVTIDVHGISNTLALAYLADIETYVDGVSGDFEPVGTAANTVADHNALTSNVHGIANTLALIKNSGDQTIDGTLTLSGLVVQGNTTVVNTVDLFIEDPLIYLASNQYDTNLVDVGFTAAYGVEGMDEENHLHTGLVKDVTTGRWKLFSNVPHPIANEIDFENAVYDDLRIGKLVSANVISPVITLANADLQGLLDDKASLGGATFTGQIILPASGIVFTDGTQNKEGVPSRTTIIQKTDSYTLSGLGERDNLIEINKSTATTLTIPLDSTLNYPVGTSIDVVQTGTGQVTIAGTGGVTVNATPGLKLRSQWSSATLFKRAANTWLVMGDLSA
jgi:hypothetical protein